MVGSLTQVLVCLIAFVIGCLINYIEQYQRNKKIGKEGIEWDELICIGGILGISITVCVFLILSLIGRW